MNSWKHLRIHISRNFFIYRFFRIISMSKFRRNKSRRNHHNSLSVAAVLRNSKKHVNKFGRTLEHCFRSHGFAANCGRQVIDSCKCVVYGCVWLCWLSATDMSLLSVRRPKYGLHHERVQTCLPGGTQP